MSRLDLGSALNSAPDPDDDDGQNEQPEQAAAPTSDGEPKDWEALRDDTNAMLKAYEPGVDDDDAAPARAVASDQIPREQFEAYQAQVREYVRQIQEQQGVSEKVAEQMIANLDHTMTPADDAEAFDRYSQLREQYLARKSEIIENHWREKALGYEQQAYQRQEQAEMQEYIPHLQDQVRRFAQEATASVRDTHLAGLSASAQKKFTAQLEKTLLEEADEGRIFFHTGEKIRGTTLPRLDVDFRRIATITEQAAATALNASAEARRRSPTLAPPGISARGDFSGESKGSADAGSFQELFDRVLREED